MTSNKSEQPNVLSPIDSFRDSLQNLDSNLKKIVETNDVQTVLDALVALHAIKSEIGVLFTQYQNLIMNIIPDYECKASNGQVIEKKSATDRKGWQHQRIAEEVLRRLNDLSVDMDTGEVVMSSQEIAVKLLDYVQPSYWRVKELSKLGINADQYCEVGEVKTSIMIRKVDTK